MSDPAASAVDKIIAEIEDRIKIEYGQAAREITQKLDKYNKAFVLKDKKWREWVANGKRTSAQYQEWRIGQIAMGERWEEMRDTIAQDLSNTSKIARSIATGYLPEVYAINHDYGTFQVERESMMDTSYTLYSREAAERLMGADPQILPSPGKKVSKEIAEGRAQQWSKTKIQSVMMQGILQGESIPDIATRLANTVCDSDRKAAIRNARTMMTATQNAGRVDSYKRANDLGIPTRKQWLATLDSRTRHEHRLLDGQIADVNEPFEVDGFKIMYPGDPDAIPRLVYNCRCSLIASIEGHDKDLRDLSQRDTTRMEESTYDEWLKAKEKTQGIMAQQHESEKRRRQYITMYREGRNGKKIRSQFDHDRAVDYQGKYTKVR